jgi:hypothetical protein
MFRKNYLIGFLTIALLLMGSVAAFAQTTAPIRGKVELKKADGKAEGVAGALIEIYRIDVKTTFPSSKTDKKGFFNFAGVPVGANFVLVVSGPNLKAVIQGGIKAGMENVLIPVEAGEGNTYTKDEVYQAIATPGGSTTQTTEMSADQKKAKEEYDKQVAEITNKNEKAKKAIEVVTAAVKEGGAAYDAKNYDLAIAKFEEGYNVDPDFAGTAPVMLNNKSLALLGRATDNYNKSVKADDATKASLKESAKNDLLAVVTASQRSLDILKTATTTDPNVQKNYESNKFLALVNRKAAYRLLSQTGLDREKGKEAAIAFQEYIAVETDPAKKLKAQADLAAALQDSGEYQLAVAEYKKVLESDPNNIDA